jgi:hypothetical protein
MLRIGWPVIIKLTGNLPQSIDHKQTANSYRIRGSIVNHGGYVAVHFFLVSDYLCVHYSSTIDSGGCSKLSQEEIDLARYLNMRVFSKLWCTKVKLQINFKYY